MAHRRRASRRDGIVRWLLPALLCHVAATLLVAALSPVTRSSAEGAASPLDGEKLESTIELTLFYDTPSSRAAGAAPAPFAAQDPPLPPPPLPSARASIKSSHLETTNLELAAATPPSPPDSDALATSPQSSDAPHPASPRLSLDQLGIGSNPFLDVHVEPLTKEELAQARLQAALRAPALERDRQLGLGPASPVANAARRLVLADDSLLETSAVLNVRVDSAGHVTAVQVLESSSQLQTWQWIAARLAQALATEPLRTASSKQGWDMKLRLTSGVQLPSGRAPGLRVGVLRQQVAGSGGPGSTSLELSPTSKLDIKEPIDSIGRHMDPPVQFETMLLQLKADTTDLGAPARRVVQVAVLSIDELSAP